jgi:small subunit ribosomal protein S20
MANSKSAKKRVKQHEVRRMRNMARQSDVKTSCRKVLDALKESNLDAAKDLLRIAEAKIARARGKGLYKKNTASRKIGNLARRVAAAARV